METKIVTGVTGPEAPAEKEEGKILGKFNSAEDLATAYQELERKFSSSEGVKETNDTGEGTGTSQEEIEEAVESAGFDYASFQAEYTENGGLSEESYTALEEGGIPRSLVDAHIEGQLALGQKNQAFADDTVAEMKDAAGGVEEYDSLVAWAGENLDDAAIEAFNIAVTSGKPALASIAIKGLMSQYNDEFGSEPALIGGAYPGDTGGKFNSTDEMVRAMQDPRYSSDSNYRKEVETKLVRSRLMGRR